MSAAQYNRALIFADAAPENIWSRAMPFVIGGRLLTGWIGTVYEEPVATTHGVLFKSNVEAKHNAMRFVRECKRIVAKRGTE